MAIPVLESSTSNTITGNTTITLTKPTGVTSGDLLLIMVGIAVGGTTDQWDDTTHKPSGFDLELEGGDNISDTHMALFSRIADGTEGATIDVSAVSSGDQWGAYIRVSGVNQTTPIDVIDTANTQQNSTSFSIPAVTTTQDDCLAFYMNTLDGANGAHSPSGTGWTEQLDLDAGGCCGSWGTKDVASAGSTGAVSMTTSGDDDDDVYWQFAIAPLADQTVTVPVVSVSSSVVAPDKVNRKQTVPVVSVASSVIAPDKVNRGQSVPVVSVSSSVVAPDKVNRGQTVPVVSVSSSVVAPDKVNRGQTVPVVSVTSSVVAPVVFANQAVVVPIVSLASSVVAPGVQFDQFVTVPLVTLASSVIAPQVDRTLVVPIVSLASSVVAPDQVNRTQLLDFVSLASSVVAPAQVNQAQLIDFVSLASSVVAPGVLQGGAGPQIVAVPVVSLISSVLAPSISGGSLPAELLTLVKDYYHGADFKGGDVIVSSIYFGSRTASGSWRMLISGSSLVFQELVSGSWVTRGQIP